MALQLHAEGQSHYSFLFTARLLAGTHSINRTCNLATCNSVALRQLKYLDAGSVISSFRILSCREHRVMAMTQICTCTIMMTHMYPAGL